jgi:hypothetical protein
VSAIIWRVRRSTAERERRKERETPGNGAPRSVLDLNARCVTWRANKERDMTRTTIADLDEAPITDLSDEQLAQVVGGDEGTRATNVVLGGGDQDAITYHGHAIE